MTVVLILPYLEEAAWKNTLKFSRESLALGYLSSFLRAHGIDVTTINAELLSLNANEVVKQISAEDTDLVGISCTAQRSYPVLLEIAENLRSNGVSAHITVGGHFPTSCHREILEDTTSIDSVIRKEGEFGLLELARCIINHRDLEDVLGLTYRMGDEIIVNPDRPRISNLDELPFPDREEIPINLDRLLVDEGYVMIMASRGCWANCSFCSVREFYGSGIRTCRSPRNVVDEIESLHKRWGVRFFKFVDDIFLDASSKSAKWIDEFNEEIVSRKLEIKYNILCRSTGVEKDTFLSMKKTGLNIVCIGVESGVQRTLDGYGKICTVEDNERAISILEEVGVEFKYGFIMINPDSTFEELKQNFYWLKKVGHYDKYNLVNRFNVYYGTPMARKLEEEGRLRKKKGVGDRFGYAYLDERVECVNATVDTLKKIMSAADAAITKAILLKKNSKASLLDLDTSETVVQSVRENVDSLERNIEDLRKEELVGWTDLFEKMLTTIESDDDVASLFEDAEKKSEELEHRAQRMNDLFLRDWNHCVEEPKSKPDMQVSS